jgi:hypothetical protein
LRFRASVSFKLRGGAPFQHREAVSSGEIRMSKIAQLRDGVNTVCEFSKQGISPNEMDVPTPKSKNNQICFEYLPRRRRLASSLRCSIATTAVDEIAMR